MATHYIFFFFFKIISLWLHWVFASRRISLVAAHGLLIAVASLVARGSRAADFSSCASQPLEHRLVVVAQELTCPRHAESSWTRN